MRRRRRCRARAHEELRGGDRLGSGVAELGESTVYRRVQLARRYDFVDQADRHGAPRVETLAGKEQRARLRGPDLRQDEGRDDGGNDAQLHFGESEDRVLGRDSDVADGCEAGASAQRRAVDSTDHWLGAVVDRAKHVAHPLGVGDVCLVRQIERRAHPVDVGAAAEDLALAGEHDGADVVGRRDAAKTRAAAR